MKMTDERFNVFDVDGTIFLEDHKKGSYHIGEIGNVDVNCLNDIADRLNELTDEIKKLRTLNYVNKEAVRLNSIKTVKIGNNDVDCSNIDWEHLYELYGAMIDYYYDGDVE